MKCAEIRHRELTPEDACILREATLMNINWLGDRFTMQDVLKIPELSHYTIVDPDRGDYGIVALQDQQWVGVVWVLFLPQDDPGFGFVASGIGELSICVRPEMRGAGIGIELLQRSIAVARTRGEWKTQRRRRKSSAETLREMWICRCGWKYRSRNHGSGAVEGAP
jgi:acetyltransferase, GNAT family